MEMSSSFSNSMIEFGDFESQLDQVAFSHDECVELPPSWPEDYKKTLSFHLPKSGLLPTTESKKAEVTQVLSSNADDGFDCNGVAPHEEGSVPNGFHHDDEQSEEAEQKENDPVATDVTVSEDNEPDTPVQDNTVSSSTTSVSVDSSSPTATASTETSPESNLPEKDGASEGAEQLEDNTTDVDVSSSNHDETVSASDMSVTSSPDDKDTPPPPQPVSVVEKKAEPVKPKSWAGLFRSSPAAATTPKPAATKQAENTAAAKTNTVQSVKPAGENAATTQSSLNTDDNVVNKTRTTRNTTQVRFEADKVSLKDVDYVQVDNDPIAEYLAGCLHDMELIYKPQAFIPRGLINTSNWCFINATLQALLVCPPFYQLLRHLETHIQPETRRVTSTPILDSFCILASEFRQLTTKRGSHPAKVDIPHGPSFEPHYIYEMLTVIKSTLSEHGRQEDAEEFQSCILNGMHDEIMQLYNYAETSTQQQQIQTNGHHDYDEDDVKDEWEEVVTTKKNRSAVTRRSDTTKTPISEMFRGELCTTVFRVGQKVSVSYEAFFSLPLDVQTERSWTVEDALQSLTNKETFADGTTDSTSDPSRQQTIETLPPVLILHLKRFVYDKLGGSKKIDKKLEYKTDLVIDRELLSKNAKKLPLAKRTYKLFAVVYHHGEKSTGGHYTTDVFHIGLSSWLRMDDQSIKQVKNNDVTRHHPSRTAYLLYYRRTDLG